MPVLILLVDVLVKLLVYVLILNLLYFEWRLALLKLFDMLLHFTQLFDCSLKLLQKNLEHLSQFVQNQTIAVILPSGILYLLDYLFHIVSPELSAVHVQFFYQVLNCSLYLLLSDILLFLNNLDVCLDLLYLLEILSVQLLHSLILTSYQV